MGDLLRFQKRAATSTERTRITKTVIDALEWDGTSWHVVWDVDIENLGVRVRAVSKNWVLRYRNAQNKQRTWTIGKTTQITVQQARALAGQANARIRLGEDPSADKQAGRIEPAEPTFVQLARTWLEDPQRRAKCKTTSTDTARMLAEKRPKHPIHKLHELRPGHDEREAFETTLLAVHRAISKTAPSEADRTVQTVQACINWHIRRRTVPAAWSNIAGCIDMNGWNKRQDYLRSTELAKFFAVVGTLRYPWPQAMLLTLLTGARMKSEVLRLRWSDVALDDHELVFRATKNGKPHRLPITPAMAAIFASIPRDHDDGFVFRGRSQAGHLNTTRRAFQIVRSKELFIGHVTAHALRHTARTYLESNLRVGGVIVDGVLNHATPGMASTYTHVGMDELRDAMLELEAFVLQHAAIDLETFFPQRPKKRRK